ncbi:MAG TPA: outer membrane protein transport protein [Anaeromyxobacteraceae bacterium]|nr:outer membrane protein transport protein [Anaeromyxobacteraceae bacterium]
MRKLAIALLLVPALASAGGYSVPTVVPRDLAMGDALVAAQDSAAATYKNPASLSRLSGLDINLALPILGNGATWNPTGAYAAANFQPVSTDFKAAFPLAAFISWSGKIADHGYGIGLGFNVPGGGNVYWPDPWAGGYAIETVNRRIYGTYLTVGFELNPQFRIGGGVVYYYGTEQLSQYALLPGPPNTACPQLPTLNPPLSAYYPQCGLASIADHGGKVSWDASVDIQPIPSYPLKLGIDFKDQANLSLTGTANLAFPPPLQPLYPNQSTTHVLPFPFVLNAGLSWNPIPELELDAAFEWEGYSAYKADTFTGSTIDPSTGKTFVVNVPRNYSDAYVYRFGVGWRVIPSLELRGGVLRDVTGVNAAVYNPSLPDANVWGGSVGLGYDFKGSKSDFLKGLSISAAFFYAWFDSLTSTAAVPAVGQPVQGFPGTYNNYAWIASLGIQWRWDPYSKAN